MFAARLHCVLLCISKQPTVRQPGHQAARDSGKDSGTARCGPSEAKHCWRCGKYVSGGCGYERWAKSALQLVLFCAATETEVANKNEREKERAAASTATATASEAGSSVECACMCCAALWAALSTCWDWGNVLWASLGHAPFPVLYLLSMLRQCQGSTRRMSNVINSCRNQNHSSSPRQARTRTKSKRDILSHVQWGVNVARPHRQYKNAAPPLDAPFLTHPLHSLFISLSLSLHCLRLCAMAAFSFTLPFVLSFPPTSNALMA